MKATGIIRWLQESREMGSGSVPIEMVFRLYVVFLGEPAPAMRLRKKGRERDDRSIWKCWLDCPALILLARLVPFYSSEDEYMGFIR